MTRPLYFMPNSMLPLSPYRVATTVFQEVTLESKRRTSLIKKKSEYQISEKAVGDLLNLHLLDVALV